MTTTTSAFGSCCWRMRRKKKKCSYACLVVPSLEQDLDNAGACRDGAACDEPWAFHMVEDNAYEEDEGHHVRGEASASYEASCAEVRVDEDADRKDQAHQDGSRVVDEVLLAGWLWRHRTDWDPEAVLHQLLEGADRS